MKFNIWTAILLLLFSLQPASGQLKLDWEDGPTTALFEDEMPVQIEFRFPQRKLMSETNDSTYLKTVMRYKVGNQAWDSLQVKVRARGNFRKENCFLAPVKVKIKKKHAEGTLFEGNKELKFVYPCFESDRGSDYVLKEFIAYKIYEKITPFHFKTRRIDVRYLDARKNKDREYLLSGFMIEDIDRVAERNNGNKLKRSVHPLQQDNICSLQNDFFQYMLANTDFSVAYQHNEKLVFVDGRMAIPVPYDFDMSGFVNTSYAVVSQVQNEKLKIDKVTQRLFRGFKRDPGIYEAIRKDYLSKKAEIFAVLEKYEQDFNHHKQYEEAREFLEGFFEILADDKKYRDQILSEARIN